MQKRSFLTDSNMQRMIKGSDIAKTYCKIAKLCYTFMQ